MKVNPWRINTHDSSISLPFLPVPILRTARRWIKHSSQWTDNSLNVRLSLVGGLFPTWICVFQFLSLDSYLKTSVFGFKKKNHDNVEAAFIPWNWLYFFSLGKALSWNSWLHSFTSINISVAWHLWTQALCFNSYMVEGGRGGGLLCNASCFIVIMSGDPQFLPREPLTSVYLQMCQFNGLQADPLPD